MQILVIINQVLNPAGFTVNRRAGRLFVNQEEYGINPADLCAIEAALQIKDSTGGKVVILSMGPQRVQDCVRQAMVMGADRGIHLDNESRDIQDPSLKAKIFVSAFNHLDGFDLIFTGDRVWDSDHGQVPLRLAEILDIPQLAGIEKLSIENGRLLAIQQRGNKFLMLETDIPALATFRTGANVPRLGNARRLIDLYRDVQAVEKWTMADLDIDQDSLSPMSQRGGRSFPQPREIGTRAVGTEDEIIEQLVSVLPIKAE